MRVKKCSRCQTSKRISEFNKNRSKPDGLCTECRDCCKINFKGYRRKFGKRVFSEEQKQRIREYQKEYQKTYRLKMTELIYAKRMFKGMLWRLNNPNYKANDLDFNLQWFLDFTLTSREYKRIYDDWTLSGQIAKLSPTLDRINNNKGYLKNNIQFLTKSDNSSKRDGETVKRWQSVLVDQELVVSLYKKFPKINSLPEIVKHLIKEAL